MTLRTPLAVLAAVALLISPIAAADKGKKSKTRMVKVRDITLTVPESWKSEKPTNRLRAGQFKLPAVKGDKEGSDLVIYFFGGAGGGADANIKRWIAQFQAKGRTTKIYRGKSAQGPYLVLDLRGTYNKPIGPPIQGKTKPMAGAQMLAVILAVKGKGNYFLKLTGPQKTVTAAGAALRQSFGADVKKETPYSKDDGKKGKKKKGDQPGKPKPKKQQDN